MVTCVHVHDRCYEESEFKFKKYFSEKKCYSENLQEETHFTSTDYKEKRHITCLFLCVYIRCVSTVFSSPFLDHIAKKYEFKPNKILECYFLMFLTVILIQSCCNVFISCNKCIDLENKSFNEFTEQIRTMDASYEGINCKNETSD